MLLSVLAACGNIEPTAAPTSAPTVAPTEAESEYGSNTCTEPSAPSEEMTEVLTEEPTIEGTVAPTEEPTEACTHEWQIVPIEECALCGETEPLEDDAQVKYHFSGPYKILGYDSWSDPQDGTEAINEDVLEILNQGLWEKEVLTIEYDCKIAINGKILWYSMVRGVFANLTDNRHLTLSHADRQTVNTVFEENAHLYWRDFSSCFRLLLTAYGPGAVLIEEDEQEFSMLTEWVSEAMENGTLEGSSQGHYGPAFVLTVDKYGKTIRFTIWDETRYSTSLHEDDSGYPYFYRADLSEIYNYLNEHYPEEFWYGDR